MSITKYVAAALLLAAFVSGDNSTASSDSCGLQPEGSWGALLEDWVTAERVQQFRHGRIMALPPTQGYYVTDRVDLVPPPPPHHHYPHHMHHRGPYPIHHSGHHGPHHGPPGPNDGPRPDPNAKPQGPGTYETQRPQPGPQDGGRPQNQPGPPGSMPPGPPQGSMPSGPPQGSMPSGPPPGPPGPPQGAKLGPAGYDEWQVTPPPPPGPEKIVNRPPNPYKDQFKPSYPYNPIPVHNGLSDRVDEVRPPPPQKQVSETDLYLLGAIEKLVYRVDLMEKRLRKMEENLHYLVVGSEVKPEPCESNFTRIGGGCYYISTDALNWKSANYACRKVKGNLLEFDGDERQKFVSGVLADKQLKGTDFWTGGLNPGLLWIWSHSAKAVSETSGANSTATVIGEGRCLALTHDPSVNTYVYKGQDCSLRHRYVCEKDEDKTKIGNEIERVARKLRERTRKPKIMWTDDE